MKKSYTILRNDGCIAFSCPGFMNLRGIIYKTLLNTFQLPMSLADLRQVDYLMVEKWVRFSKFKIEKIVGGLYNLGWGETGVKDLVERLPKVFQDKPIKEANLKMFNKWIETERILYNDFNKFLLNTHLIKIGNSPKLKLFKPKQIKNTLWQEIKNYLINGFKGDYYYREDYPFNLWGGETIYLLKKQ